MSSKLWRLNEPVASRGSRSKEFGVTLCRYCRSLMKPKMIGSSVLRKMLQPARRLHRQEVEQDRRHEADDVEEHMRRGEPLLVWIGDPVEKPGDECHEHQHQSEEHRHPPADLPVGRCPFGLVGREIALDAGDDSFVRHEIRCFHRHPTVDRPNTQIGR